MGDDWDQAAIDNEMLRDEEPDECDCQFADVDILEGRVHCPMCGNTYYMTADQLRAELANHAECMELIMDEAEAAASDKRSPP
jgi:hypothetical protein